MNNESPLKLIAHIEAAIEHLQERANDVDDKVTHAQLNTEYLAVRALKRNYIILLEENKELWQRVNAALALINDGMYTSAAVALSGAKDENTA